MEIERVDMDLQHPLPGIRDGRIENGDMIPEWLLVEVLVRLSIKLVFRFKLVSKQWLSIISDPLFARTYISRASSLLSPRWTFISHFMYHHKGYKDSRIVEYMLLDDAQYSQVIKPGYCVLPIPTSQPSHDGEQKYMVEGVSNGLVLYSLSTLNRDMVPNNLMHNYYICNPVTRLWITLPTLTCRVMAQSCGFHTHVEDGVLKSYTVVRIQLRSRYFHFMVFSSETGEWKSCHRFRVIGSWHPLRMQATLVNLVLHWVASVGIIAYDPHQSTEQARVIAFPIDSQGKVPCYSLCDEYEGKLRYFENRTGNASQQYIKLWVRNDHITGGNWSLQHKMEFTHYTGRPISFHPFDSDVVYLMNHDLVSYNIKTKVFEIKHKITDPEQTPDWCYAFLLVIPPWPISFH